MDIAQLAKEVKQMRNAQKLYFRTRQGLEYVKKLEKMVDGHVESIIQEQLTLPGFEDDGGDNDT